jgi:hypothetical protein
LGGSVQYNNTVKEINQLVDQGLYKESYLKLKKIRNETIFDNQQLSELAYVLSLKLPSNSIKFDIQKEKLSYAEKGILFAREKDFKKTNEYIKAGIILNTQDDSLVKLYEIYEHLNQLTFDKPNLKSTNIIISTQLSSKLTHNDAILVLDLMKKKEKLLNY